MRVSNKSETTIDLMEKRMKKKEVVREKTEFELMKERTYHNLNIASVINVIIIVGR